LIQVSNAWDVLAAAAFLTRYPSVKLKMGRLVGDSVIYGQNYLRVILLAQLAEPADDIYSQSCRVAQLHHSVNENSTEDINAVSSLHHPHHHGVA
jgi:hypothetical protein